MNEKEFQGIAENKDLVVYCLSHIARQLTIRNEQERHHAKRLHGIFEAIVEIVDRPKPTPDVPTDALVEAVKELMSDSECYCPENVAHKEPCGFCRVQSALAAHEKEKSHER